MIIPENVKEMFMNAEGKALATIKDGEAHVVPVSTIKIEDDKIILINYFFGQTLENIKKNSRVAISAWKGLEGFQIKADVEYVTEGEKFESLKSWVAESLPERVVLGVLLLTPVEIFDVSATANKPGAKIL